MTKIDYKSIGLKFETYTRLMRRKKYPEESFDKVINRILDGDINEPQR
jgi:predicted CopG family antitoxin